jgi:hypothetical protein
MKKVIFTFSLFFALFFAANTAKAGIPIIYSSGEKIDVAKELPDDALIDGQHVNLGVMYEQFAIFWIPIWNYGETKFVLVNNNNDLYYDLTEEDIEILKTEFNVDVPKKPTIDFWNKIGGKLVWVAIILIGGGIWLAVRKSNDDEEAKA